MKRAPAGSALLLLTATALASTASPAAAASPVATGSSSPAWRVSTSVSVGSHSTQMFGVTSAAPIPSWTWAVGGTTPVSGTGGATPVAETWNGRAWSRLTVPPKAVSALGPDPVLVTATAARDNRLWAFTPSGGWLVKFGSSWTAGRLSKNSPVAIDSSLAYLSDGGAWAFGALETPGGFMPYAAYSGAVGFSWKQVPVPGKGTIVSSAVAPRGGSPYAVLENGTFPQSSPTSSLVHWTGREWQTVGLPAALRHAALGSILVRAGNSIWLGGAVKNARRGTTEVIGHWNGHGWQVTTLPAPATAAPFRITSMTTDGSGGIWALATCFASQCPNGAASRLWHETAGRWTGPQVPALASKPTVLVGLYNMRHGVWAAGSVRLSKTRSNGVIALWGVPPA
jgi:hypothetical protein